MIGLLARRRETTRIEEITRPETAEPEPARPFLILAPDACGPAARRLHTFPDSNSAADFIRFWFPACYRRGLAACWTLPDGIEGPSEALVLVRDEADRDIVYPFSFSDMDGALSFAREEAESGLDLRRVLLLNVLPVNIKSSSEKVVEIFPPQQPQAPRPPEMPFIELIDGEEQTADGLRYSDDIAAMVQEVLRVRRWAPRAEAFAGFGSPPGRF